MAKASFARQLLAAVARNTPAFQPLAPTGGRPGLLAALARSTPAFGGPGSREPVERSHSGHGPASTASDVQIEDETPSNFWDDENVVVLPRLDLIRERAAATERAAPIELQGVSEQLSGRYLLRAAAPGEVELLIETSQAAGDLAFQVRAGAAGRKLDYLVLPTADPSGVQVADLLIPTAGASVEIRIARRRVSSLGAGDVTIIQRSVRRTGRAGRNAWRAIARARPAGDSVREAILLEL
jgi:hypothetical protein